MIKNCVECDEIKIQIALLYITLSFRNIHESQHDLNKEIDFLRKP